MHGGILFSKIVAGHKVKQWRRLLSSSKSKSNLIEFLAQDWQKQSLRTKLLNKVMYVICERKCFRVTEDTWSEVESLYSTQEEADTRCSLMLLKTQMCSSCPFCLPMSLLVKCTLKAGPKPERNLLMCRRLLLLLVTICAVHLLHCIRSQTSSACPNATRCPSATVNELRCQLFRAKK